MKKLIVIALAVIMALSLVVVLAACGGETYEGSCNYEHPWTAGAPDYGVKVKVTVKGDVITKVVLVDYAEWTRTSDPWPESTDKQPGDAGYQLGHDKTEAAYDQWLKDTFVGQKVADVLTWEATATKAGQTVGEGVPHLVGATQSCARIIVAVKDALSKIPAAE